jgi:hypothetical protein
MNSAGLIVGGDLGRGGGIITSRDINRSPNQRDDEIITDGELSPTTTFDLVSSPIEL